MNETEVIKTFKSDVQNADPFHREWVDKQANWINEYEGRPYGNEDPKKRKASIVSRDIKISSIWQRVKVVDAFVNSKKMVKTIPITGEDTEMSREKEMVLNHQWSRDFDNYNFIDTGFNILQREGTVFAKVSWEYDEVETEVKEPIMGLVPVTDPQKAQAMLQQGMPPVEEGIVDYQMVKRMVPIYNRPTAEIINNAFVYVDPTVEGNAVNGQFIVIKYSSSLSKLKENADIYKNLDQVEKTVNSELDKTESNYDNDDGDFKFTDTGRREFEVVEYWGNYDLNNDGIAEPIVAMWVGDTCIRLEPNPYPDQKLPFVSCVIDAEPFSPYGNPIANIIGTDQKIQTGIKRSLLDTLNKSTNGQKGFPNGALDPRNKRLMQEGKDFEFNADFGNIWEGHYNQLPSDIFNFSRSIKQNTEELTGSRPFATGQGSMGSATEARGALDAIAKREIDITRNFAENFILPILKKWDSMNTVFLEDEEIERITNKPKVPYREDRRSNIDIDIDISTAESEANKASELAFMLQTLGQSLPFDLTKIILSEIASMKQMPELADKIKEYQPQPDPIEEKKRELELGKLQVEIEERKSRAIENESDKALKDAKTQSELAKTRATHAKADLDDQKFVRTQDGSEHMEDMAKENNKAKNTSMINALNNTPDNKNK